MNDTVQTWQIRVVVPRQAVPAIEDAIADEDSALSSFEIPGSALWSVEVVTADPPDRAAIEARLQAAAEAFGIPQPELSIEELAQRDWVAESLKGLNPVRAGRFFVHGGHDRERRPAGAIAMQVEAAAAFGTGHHETTRGCLLLLDGLARRQQRFANPLDLGCGTAVLAMATAACWRIPVLASDIDPTAVRIAGENVRLNGLDHLVTCLTARGLAHPTLRTAAPYDLVMANILARPLMALAPAITRAAPHATLILSGILRHQARPVTGMYRQLGWRLQRRLNLGDWSCLQMQRF